MIRCRFACLFDGDQSLPGRSPGSICDALATNRPRNLRRRQLDRFGEIVHHDAGKALSGGNMALASQMRDIPESGERFAADVIDSN
jgi:hypothetical protein